MVSVVVSIQLRKDVRRGEHDVLKCARCWAGCSGKAD